MAKSNRSGTAGGTGGATGTSTAKSGSGGAAAAAVPTHILVAGPFVTQILYPYSTPVPGAATAEISATYMNQFLNALDNLQVDITAASASAQCDELEADLASAIAGLPANNPIQGVHVVRSRITGDPTVWDTDSMMSAYPLTTATGASPPTFAVARIVNAGGATVGYVHANVVAVTL